MTASRQDDRQTGRQPRSGGWFRSVAAVIAVIGFVAVGFGVPMAEAQTRRIIQLDEEIIEGRIEKPEAFYILQPTNLNYESAEQAESFIPDLLRTVEELPF